MISLKSIVLISLFSTILPMFCVAQTYRIQYEQTFDGSGYEIPKHVDAARKAMMMKRLRERSQEKRLGELTYSQGVSQFEMLDTMLSTTAKPGERSRNKRFGDRVYFKKLTHDTTYAYGGMGLDGQAIYQVISEQYPWVIGDEATVINGFPSIKATAAIPNDRNIEKTDTIVAWFTPEIPIPDGPAAYAGLPGLIMEIHSPVYNYKISDIIVIQEPQNLEMPEGLELISQSEFEEKMRAFRRR